MKCEIQNNEATSPNNETKSPRELTEETNLCSLDPASKPN